MFNARILILVQPAGQLGWGQVGVSSAGTQGSCSWQGLLLFWGSYTWDVNEALSSLHSPNIVHSSSETIS